MRKPRNRSDSSRLVSGTTSFPPQGALLGTLVLTIVPPVPLNRASVVAVSIDDRLGDFPPAGAFGPATVSVFGGIAANGDIELYLVNGSTVAVATSDIFVNYIVIPQ